MRPAWQKKIEAELAVKRERLLWPIARTPRGELQRDKRAFALLHASNARQVVQTFGHIVSRRFLVGQVDITAQLRSLRAAMLVAWRNGRVELTDAGRWAIIREVYANL